MDADCLGCVGTIAGAGRPIPYEAIVCQMRMTTEAEGVRQNQGMLAPQASSHREGKVVHPDGEPQGSRVATGDVDLTRAGTGISRKVHCAGKAGVSSVEPVSLAGIFSVFACETAGSTAPRLSLRI